MSPSALIRDILPRQPMAFHSASDPAADRLASSESRGTSSEDPLDAEARALLGTLAEQTAAAFDRVFLADEMMTARSAAETERVRNILLASVSHDFRTPLASILGSATSLLDFGDKLDTDAKTGLLTRIKAEAEGLNEMVRNLLAMTRIDAGALELRRDWVDLREIVERVINAAKRRGAALAAALDLPAETSADPRRCDPDRASSWAMW